MRGKLTRMETTRDGREVDTYSMTNEQRAAVGVAVAAPIELPAKATTNGGAAPDTYRMVDFVRPVAMRDERGQEVRVDRVRLGASVDRESSEKVASIVLNGTWFDITTQRTDDKMRDARCYRVHVTNTVSAER